jgi:hypothetical protein
VLVRAEPNQAIAENLGISAKTVGRNVQHVNQKAGVRSRAAPTPGPSSTTSLAPDRRSPDADSASRAHARRVTTPEREE